MRRDACWRPLRTINPYIDELQPSSWEPVRRHHLSEVSAVTDLFSDKAQDWDKREMVVALSKALGHAITTHVPLRSSMKVLDFGAGTGLLTASLVPHVAHVLAVDISPSMLEALAAKPELQGKVKVVCQDIIEAPLPQKFDLLVSAMAMHHVRDTDAMVKTFAEHVAPGGLVALADLDSEDGTFHPPDMEGVYHAGFDRRALQGTLEAHGFTDVVFHTAHEVVSPTRRYPVFLVVATKGQARSAH
jgi:2-polyprenyl-3-methyl-5-hydroxy-6-metoxy-1,4-benzoquinol methylase